MIDYKGLEALATVIQMNSFEVAANKLHITQPAVSQRIKSLENYFGMPLLQRTQPYQPTRHGELLLSHYRKTKILEDNIAQTFKKQIAASHLSIAINRDSMDTWFFYALQKLQILNDTRLEIIAVDQEITINYFKKGLVSGCISTQEKPVSGCEIEFLGYMDYVLVATPEFQRRYFKNKLSAREKMLNAPAVIFDVNDYLHEHYLKKYFKIEGDLPPYHIAPSVKCFRSFALAGYGCALIPRLDIEDKLAAGQLVELYPKKIWRMPLYWHSWAIPSDSYQMFNETIIETARTYLAQT